MPFNFYDTHTLLMSVRDLEPSRTFLRDRYFPTNDNTDVFSTTDVLVEYMDGGKRLAPFVVPRAGGVPVARNGYEMKRYTPACIKPKRTLSIDDLTRRGFGEALLSTLTPEQRQHVRLMADADELIGMIRRREEAMAAETLLTNGCVMKHVADDGTIEDEKEVRFYNGEANPAAYTPSGTWATDYDKILDDLAVMVRMLTTLGLPATELLMAPDVADAIVKNRTIKELFDIRNYNLGNVKPEELPAGAAKVCTLNVMGRMIDAISYDETYIDGNGNRQQYIPAGNIVLTAPGCGRALYGAVSQVEQADGAFHTYTGRYVPKYLADATGNTRSLTMTSCPLLVPNHKNAFITAKVL